MFVRTLAMAVLLACGTGAQAQTIFSDNFDADTIGLNKTSWLQEWTVSDGTVDLIGAGSFDFFPANGKYVDLDGSSGEAGLFGNRLMLAAGQTYKLSFSLAGNQRNNTGDNVEVIFGSSISTFSRSGTAGFETESVLFQPSLSGTYQISFDDLGGDNIGALLDNVSVSAVPEPNMLGMLLAGLVGMGALIRRKQQTS